MAQTGFTPLLIYSSSTGGNAPTASNLLNNATGSELAINIADGKLFYKDSGNAVQVIAWKTTPTTAGGTGLTTWSAGQLPYYSSGTTLSQLNIGTSGYFLTSSGSAPQWTDPTTLAVTSISFGTTGLTPSTATKGDVTVAGTLSISNGGTGLTSTPSNGQIDIGNGSGFTRTTISAGSGISVTNGSGSITIANTQNTGPAFSAYQSSGQTISSNTQTKIQCQTKEFDTNSNYDNSTNYRFTPTVAGYYQISGAVRISYTGANELYLSIFKNGSEIKRTFDFIGVTIASYIQMSISALIYLNGSTDYVELYMQQNSGVSQSTSANVVLTYFQAAMIRGS